MESGGGCRYDYVQVSDSMSNGSLVQLGRYCDQTTPPVITSSVNRLVVKFRSDGSIHHTGFSANWTIGCGGTFTADNGIILSPGYPNAYDNSLNCQYNIAVNPEKFIVLSFDRKIFDIENGATCQYDAITAYAGNDTTGRQLGKFCGSSLPQPISSLGNMVITFITDGSIALRGFKAKYRAEACGGVYTDASGFIRTPTHPSPYQHNANCTWIITVAENRAIQFKFLTFDIEGHSRCTYDYVEIRDGNNATSRLIGRYCGSKAPKFVFSLGNKMYVKFVTDSSVSRGGFSARYRTTYGPNQGCGGLINNTSGTLTSVDGDGDGFYENNLYCQWTIQAGDNKVVMFNVTGLDVENSTTCGYDFLMVYDGMSSLDPLIGKYCGNNLPPPITSSSNFLFVRFYTDSSIVKRGFNASYGQRNALCGGTLFASNVSQIISSPNYPSTFGQKVKCRWLIDSGADNEKVRLTLTALDLVSNNNCPREFVQFRDSPLGTFGQTIHYCGSTLPAPYDSVGRVIMVNFKLPSGSRSTGFQLSYQVADCNQNITGENGRLISPGFPRKYQKNIDCFIRITAPVGRKLAIYFNMFDIEPHGQCNFDFLEIHNGTSHDDGVAAKLCGSTLPDPVFIPNNEILLEFHTDSSVTRKGYDFTYTSTPFGLGCGGNLSGINGSLTSPGYPGNNSDVQTCMWAITVPVRRTVTLTFTTLSSIGVADCDNNYVSIYNGDSQTSPIFGRYCGNTDVAPLTTSSNTAYVKYTSLGSSNGPLFRLTYSS